MKKVIGFLITLCCMPLFIILISKIVDEFDTASAFHEQLEDAIELKPITHEVPILIKDRDGIIFTEEYIEWRTPLTLSEIPLFVQQLFIESEDVEFYNHRGFDIAAIVRAFVINSQTDDLKQGASTITQQLVRMRFLTTDKTYERKITELFYANEIEKQMTKDEILEMYLNEMYFGNQVYGIGSAATYYFGKPLQQLTEAEIAFIAAIPNNPSLYDPIRNFEATKARQERLLTTVSERNILPYEQTEQLKSETINLSIKQKANHHPAYSTYVLHEAERLIGTTEGYLERIKKATDPQKKQAIQDELTTRTASILASGVIIETAIDQAKQQHDERVLTPLLQQHNVQSGAVVIDNATREIVSIYAGKDYKKADFNRGYQAVRQPGSAIKPLLVYAPFLESGRYTATTPISSRPICIGNYCPENIGGFVYGTTSMAEAFRQSHNTAAVRLLQRVGIEEAFSYLNNFQFEHFVESDKNYSAALGGFQNGVSPLELADAFTSFIDGTYEPAHAIRYIKDYEGNILYTWPDETKTVWSPSTVTIMRDLLKEVVTNGSGKGVHYQTSYTGAKTGTTNKFYDLWTAGLSDTYTTAVWIGQDTPASIQKQSNQKVHLQAFSRLIQ